MSWVRYSALYVPQSAVVAAVPVEIGDIGGAAFRRVVSRVDASAPGALLVATAILLPGSASGATMRVAAKSRVIQPAIDSLATDTEDQADDNLRLILLLAA